MKLIKCDTWFTYFRHKGGILLRMRQRFRFICSVLFSSRAYTVVPYPGETRLLPFHVNTNAKHTRTAAPHYTEHWIELTSNCLLHWTYTNEKFRYFFWTRVRVLGKLNLLNAHKSLNGLIDNVSFFRTCICSLFFFFRSLTTASVAIDSGGEIKFIKVEKWVRHTVLSNGPPNKIDMYLVIYDVVHIASFYIRIHSRSLILFVLLLFLPFACMNSFTISSIKSLSFMISCFIHLFVIINPIAANWKTHNIGLLPHFRRMRRFFHLANEACMCALVRSLSSGQSYDQQFRWCSVSIWSHLEVTETFINFVLANRSSFVEFVRKSDNKLCN